jgi:galactokinase
MRGSGQLDRQEMEKRRAEFAERFGAGERADLYFAPGRVNLIGEHTDYNGGLVLPMAIEQGTYLLIRPSGSPPARLYSANTGEEAYLEPDSIERRGDWADYARGVLQLLRGACGEIPPFDAMYFGDLPLGAGLSSSASMEVATALGASSLGCSITREEAVRVSWVAENEFVGMSCGVMDQYAVTFSKAGYLLLLDCDSLEYRHIPFNLAGVSLVVGHTGVYRSLAASDYNLRRRECEEALVLISQKIGERRNLGKVGPEEFERVKSGMPEKLRARAQHVIEENLRVKGALRCLEKGDPEGLGSLMNGSHASLRDLFQVSCRELDALQEICVSQAGVWGCRMTGGGFGGCVIAMVSSESLEEYLDKVPDLYRQATGQEPFFLVVEPRGGAERKGSGLDS